MHADIVIYGSTSAAVASAIQCARLGRSCALISPSEHIGGIQVNGLGSSDIDNQAEFQNSTTIRGGLALELHRRISDVYGRRERLEQVVRESIKDPEVWRFEPHVIERVIADWLAEQGPLLHIITSRLAEDDDDGSSTATIVQKEGTTLQSIRLENGITVHGKLFIDATYEGDLLAASGIPWTHGRESSSTYGESLAGVRDQTPYRQIDVPVDPHVTPGDPSSGLLYGISGEPFGAPGDGDAHLQAYSFRLTLTDDPANRIPFARPAGYDPAHYELHRRYLAAGGSAYVPLKRLPGGTGKTDLIGSESALATDLLGMNDGWPLARTAAERRRIYDDMARFTKGLMWFFASDEAVPPGVREEWARFGYCRDEFPDNGHFPREPYVRDGRRMVSSRYVITEATASQGVGEGEEPEPEPQVPDPVAVAFWPTDTHSVRRVLRDGQVHNEGFVFKDGHRWRPFGIAYRALTPDRGVAGSNFLTPTCPSSSHVGYGAVRLEHQFYALGQACALAGDIALREGCAVQDVPYGGEGGLEEALLGCGIVLDAEKVGMPSI